MAWPASTAKKPPKTIIVIPETFTPLSSVKPHGDGALVCCRVQFAIIHSSIVPALTKAQIIELKKALPKCRISHNATK